jgi:hypothetical protein
MFSTSVIYSYYLSIPIKSAKVKDHRKSRLLPVRNNIGSRPGEAEEEC